MACVGYNYEEVAKVSAGVAVVYGMSIKLRHVSAKVGQKLTISMPLKDWQKAESAYDPDCRYKCEYGGKSYYIDPKGSLLDYLVEFDETVLWDDHTFLEGVCYMPGGVLRLFWAVESR